MESEGVGWAVQYSNDIIFRLVCNKYDTFNEFDGSYRGGLAAAWMTEQWVRVLTLLIRVEARL